MYQRLPQPPLDLLGSQAPPATETTPAEEESAAPEFIEMTTKPPQCGNGADQSTSPLVASSPLNIRCVKCINALVTCAVMPCGHCCLCGICGQTVLSLKQVCPVCRKTASTVIGYTNLVYNVYR